MNMVGMVWTCYYRRVLKWECSWDGRSRSIVGIFIASKYFALATLQFTNII